jgi:hypothetical protein
MHSTKRSTRKKNSVGSNSEHAMMGNCSANYSMLIVLHAEMGSEKTKTKMATAGTAKVLP